MWPWLGAHVLEILIFLATAVEAGALVYIYKLEKRQAELQEGRNRIDLRVDIDFPEGHTTGYPYIWIENAGAGSGFIESAELIVTQTETRQKMGVELQDGGNQEVTRLRECSCRPGLSPPNDRRGCLERADSRVEGQSRALGFRPGLGRAAGPRSTKLQDLSHFHHEPGWRAIGTDPCLTVCHRPRVGQPFGCRSEPKLNSRER